MLSKYQLPTGTFSWFLLSVARRLGNVMLRSSFQVQDQGSFISLFNALIHPTQLTTTLKKEMNPFLILRAVFLRDKVMMNTFVSCKLKNSSDVC